VSKELGRSRRRDGYPALPVLSAGTPEESLQGYGLRVLGFVVAYGCTATLSLDDLKLADHTYPIAVARADLDIRVLNTLHTARRLILSAIGWLEREDDAPVVPIPSVPDIDTPGGAHDRLIPKPKPLAPTGAANFAF
jgi:hypothetical protein